MTDFKQKYLALYRSYRRTLEILKPFRETMVNIKDGIEDEGDRAYFGSTNAADQFKDIADTLDGLIWDELEQPAHTDASNLYQELADAKADAQRLHKEKMALVEVLLGVDADYMTSEKHHPGYVLIPTEKFEQLRAAAKPAS